MDKKYTRLALEATDQEYLDNSGVSRKLGFHAIDTFWNAVLEYRADFRKTLPFRLVNNKDIYLTATPVILKKFEDLEERLGLFVHKFAESLSESERREARKLFLFDALRAYVNFSKVQITELTLKALINGTYHQEERAHKGLIAYLRALDSYSEKSPLSPDSDLLAEIYQNLRGEEELTSFYREKGVGSISRNIFFNYDYDRAPDGHIEEYIDPFFSFLLDERSHLPSVLKVFATLFYFPYIAPFESFNQESALLLAKDVLAERYEKEAFFLPLEILLMPNPSYTQAVKNVRASGDITYFLSYCEKRLQTLIPGWEELLSRAKIEVYAPEYSQLSKEEKLLVEKEVAKAPLPPKNEQLSLENFFPSEKQEPEKEVKPEPELTKEPEPLPEKEETLPETPEETTVLPKKEEPSPLGEKPEVTMDTPSLPEKKEEEPAVVPTKETEPLKKPIPRKEPANALPPSRHIDEETMRLERENHLEKAQENDFLSEKEAKEYMKYLLESNPNLNRKQASFLSTHCTPGRFYTIQQFKAHARCVYETARTSMDKLAREGYYEKLQVKNRFVYTPKKRN